VRSAIAAQVKLARLADLLAELSGIVREVAQESLAVHAERALMCNVNEPTRLLTAEDLAARLQVDARTIRRWRKTGKFPAGIELGDSVIRWHSEEIDAWLASGGNP
jgi:predicted DNA-binding transcriptional regulator AlpA